MIDRFYEVLLQRINEAMQEAVKPCVDNSYQTLEQYKFANGRIRGLQIADEIVRKLFNDWYEGKSLNKDVINHAPKFELYTSS